MKRSGARDRHRYVIDGRDQIRREIKSGGQSVIGSEDAGNCSGGLEKGTLASSGRDGKGAGKTNV
jgi:hypothetical protein